MSPTSIAAADLRVVHPLGVSDRRKLLTLARRAVCDRVEGDLPATTSVEDLPPRLREQGASFVTLRKGDRLLGAVGSVSADRALAVDVTDHALAAAFADPRIPPITAADVGDMTVEVAVLGPLVPTGVGSFGELRELLRPQIDGLVVGLGARRYTFLPAVWREVRDVDDFLALLWRKAGLSRGSWPADIKTWTYQVETVSDRPAG